MSLLMSIGVSLAISASQKNSVTSSDHRLKTQETGFIAFFKRLFQSFVSSCFQSTIKNDLSSKNVKQIEPVRWVEIDSGKFSPGFKTKVFVANKEDHVADADRDKVENEDEQSQVLCTGELEGYSIDELEELSHERVDVGVRRKIRDKRDLQDFIDDKPVVHKEETNLSNTSKVDEFDKFKKDLFEELQTDPEKIKMKDSVIIKMFDKIVGKKIRESLLEECPDLFLIAAARFYEIGGHLQKSLMNNKSIDDLCGVAETKLLQQGIRIEVVKKIQSERIHMYMRSLVREDKSKWNQQNWNPKWSSYSSDLELQKKYGSREGIREEEIDEEVDLSIVLKPQEENCLGQKENTDDRLQFITNHDKQWQKWTSEWEKEQELR